MGGVKGEGQRSGLQARAMVRCSVMGTGNIGLWVDLVSSSDVKVRAR